MKKTAIQVTAIALLISSCNDNGRTAKVRYLDNGTTRFEQVNKLHDVGDTVEITHTVSSWRDDTRQAVIIKYIN